MQRFLTHWIKIRVRGEVDFDASDFESVPYLVAIIKVRPNSLPFRLTQDATQETLGMHPIVIGMHNKLPIPQEQVLSSFRRLDTTDASPVIASLGVPPFFSIIPCTTGTMTYGT